MGVVLRTVVTGYTVGDLSVSLPLFIHSEFRFKRLPRFVHYGMKLIKCNLSYRWIERSLI